MAEFRKLPTQAELQQMLYAGQLQGKSTQDIINENLARGTTIKALPESFFTTAGAGARQAAQFVNKAGTAQDLAKLFPGYTGQTTVPIPTHFNFAEKMDPYSGQAIPSGLQTQQIPYGNILKAIKPADVLGLTGTAQTYSDIGAGKAPNTMDVLDTVGLGAAMVKPAQVGFKVGKGLLEAGGRSLAPTAMDMAYKYAGPGSRIDPAMYVYRPSTPLKPDQTLGTRFEREYIGGLADKNPVNIEDLKGSSLMLMPWDSTSRNYRIKSISDELLANPVITHGGQDYARDLEHISKNIGGASNLSIAKRIKNRDTQTRLENLQAGGTGQVVSLPTTMGDYSEFFSVMPTQAIFGLLDSRTPTKKIISEIDKAIRTSKAPGEDKLRMKNFKGLMSEEGRMQLLTGEGLDTTAGNARIAVMQKLALKGNQEKLGFNIEDLSAALTDPALSGVPKGYVGNTVLGTGQEGMHLRQSINPSYNTDFTANYLGTLGQNVPVEVLFPKTFDNVLREMAGKKGSVRNMAIGALEKRGKNFSEFVDQQVIDNYYNYLDQQKKLGLIGN